MEEKQLELYKMSIDDIVKLRPDVFSRWIMGNGWPKLAENEKINQVLNEFTADQKEVFALISQSA